MQELLKGKSPVKQKPERASSGSNVDYGWTRVLYDTFWHCLLALLRSWYSIMTVKIPLTRNTIHHLSHFWPENSGRCVCYHFLCLSIWYIEIIFHCSSYCNLPCWTLICCYGFEYIGFIYWGSASLFLVNENLLPFLQLPLFIGWFKFIYFGKWKDTYEHWACLICSLL